MSNKHFKEIINHYIFLPGSRKKWQQKFRKNTFYVTMVTQLYKLVGRNSGLYKYDGTM